MADFLGKNLVYARARGTLIIYLLLLLDSLEFFYGAHGVHGEGPASLLSLLGSVEFINV